MGSNGFSSEGKQKRVDLLKQLLDTNISTQGSSNPLEALLSGLDLGSLEDLMQKNKKSHHGDWDSKKKRHHDDDWDSKKKRHHDDDWDSKKKHDHDDCGCKKKKHDHDDCGCKKKKHDHDDCGCKKKKRKECECSDVVTASLCDLIAIIFALLDNPPASVRSDLREFLIELRQLLVLCDCIPSKLLCELDELIDDLQGTTPSTAVLLIRTEEFLTELLKCLGLEDSECGGGDGGGDCTCGDETGTLCTLITTIRTTTGEPRLTAIRTLRNFLLTPAGDCVRQGVRRSIIAIATAILRNGGNSGLFNALGNALDRLELCLGGCEVTLTPTVPTLITTVRERLLDLLADQVVITTPTGIYGGTLVAVQADYIAVVAPTGTYLIPLDQIQTFTTE
ncbi:YuzF family protein [Priestia megaterium]|uniref:YuzF family protein n=1 Tax=Priestia megaterium TaxID=1404 RepID=UPI0021F3F4F3|nr:YuzF family protein [Priestia megaterium]UYP07522.1 YuzF family protein [Priestia megaterium]